MKFLKCAFLLAACLFFNDNLTAQSTVGGDWMVTGANAGARATMVVRDPLPGRSNDGFRGQSIFNSPLQVGAGISDNVSGDVDARLFPDEHTLTVDSMTRPPILGWRRAREIATSGSTWTYIGPPRTLNFTLTMDGDHGATPIMQPFDFFRFPDVIMDANENVVLTGTIVVVTPDGGFVRGTLVGDGQTTNWDASPGIVLDIDANPNPFGPNPFFNATFSMQVEAGDQFTVVIDDIQSDTLIRPGNFIAAPAPPFTLRPRSLGPFHTRITTGFKISEFEVDGPLVF